MNKTEYRAVIKLLVSEGLRPSEIHSKFIQLYGASSPSVSTIKKWAAEFRRGRDSLEDVSREGRPKSATTPKVIEQVHDIVLNERRVTVSEIAESIGISKERVGYILHEELNLTKLCARWVPRFLSSYQKSIRMNVCEQCLELFNNNKTSFIRRFIIMDETWIYYSAPESNLQPGHLKEAGCSAPKKTKRVPLTKKVMVWVFWDAEGLLFIDHPEKYETITGEYYSNLLTTLEKKIRQKRPGLENEKIILYQDNAPAHGSVLTMGKLSDVDYELLELPPYSPDLAPSDFYLFPKLRLFLSGQRFSSNQEIIAAIEGYFVDLTENHYKNGIMALEHRWIKCVSFQGDYVEN